MAPHSLIDSHIHLWPEETTNEECHAWMTAPDMPLAKPHLLQDYYAVTDEACSSDAELNVRGVIYVETDVRYVEPNGDVASWAKGPLDEIGFLRSLVEGRYGARDAEMLLGAVPWAPLHQPPRVLEEYLNLAQERTGPDTWRRVKGFRFLLQFYLDPTEFKELVLSADFKANLKLLGKRGYSFDIGVDQHRAGVWQLEIMSEAMHKAHEGAMEGEKVIFIVNHMCKPTYENVSFQSIDTPGGAFGGWCNAMTAMASCSRTYMKLSGQFSELPPGSEPIEKIAASIRPWVNHVMSCFGPRRTMFGSDWPVCNVNGPFAGKSWLAWRDVVELALADPDMNLSELNREWVWNKTAAEAYRI
ncbi:L-rhamnono-gamma-lactonase [Friedmanniomyces endolithicus]|nr:L-rhamnono-gamma-lactonase [Friedmanniomyces endolithicus]